MREGVISCLVPFCLKSNICLVCVLMPPPGGREGENEWETKRQPKFFVAMKTCIATSGAMGEQE